MENPNGFINIMPGYPGKAVDAFKGKVVDTLEKMQNLLCEFNYGLKEKSVYLGLDGLFQELGSDITELRKMVEMEYNYV